MAALLLTRDAYRSKAYGGWLGRMIGATLGAPLDGAKEMRSLSFYDPVPGQAIADDGLDLQLLWLNALRTGGIEVSSDALACLLRDHVTYPWDEYGCADRSLRRGLRPPITGSFDNWFRDGTRGWGRAEVWALTAPGSPQTAAAAAYRDAVVDHSGEGIWAAMMWAAMESAAFFVDSTNELIQIGLSMVPAESRVARAVLAAKDAHRASASMLEAWTRVLGAVRHENYTDAPQNVGFAVLALLYGAGDFGASVCTAAGCGFHAPQTAAAAGALIGIRLGRSGLPANWTEPIGESVIQGWGVTGVDFERTLTELVEHTLEVAEQILPAKCPGVELVDALPAPAAPFADAPADAPSAEGTPATEKSAAEDAMPQPVPLGDAMAAPGVGTVAALSGGEQPVSAPEGEPGIAIQETPAVSLVQPSDPPTGELATDSAAAAAVTSGPMGETAGGDVAPTEPIAEPPASGAPMTPSVNWRENAAVLPLLTAASATAVYHADGFELTVDYGSGGPVILPGAARSFTVEIRNLRDEDFVGFVNLGVPQGWQVAVPGAQGQRQMLGRGRMARYGFVVKAPEDAVLHSTNEVSVVLTPEKSPAIAADLPLLSGACWWFVGPFRNLADEGFERAYGPEDNQALEKEYLARDGGLVRWQKMAFGETVMDLTPIFRGAPGVAYGLTTLHVASPTPARIVAHTNDGVKIWLNGQRVVNRHSHEPFRPTMGYGPGQADVDLKAGDNRVLVKVVECAEPVRFAFSVADRSGRPLADVGNTRW